MYCLFVILTFQIMHVEDNHVIYIFHSLVEWCSNLFCSSFTSYRGKDIVSNHTTIIINYNSTLISLHNYCPRCIYIDTTFRAIYKYGPLRVQTIYKYSLPPIPIRLLAESIFRKSIFGLGRVCLSTLFHSIPALPRRDLFSPNT